MPSIEQIKNELKDIDTLRLISNALLEVSAIKIRTLRTEFERNQEFFSEMNDLYNIVKGSAIDKNYDLKKEGKGKKIIVAITSNQRFHGNLNKIVMEEFVKKNIEKDTDYLVVGNTGRRLIESEELKIKPEYMVFKNDYPTPRETDVFLNKVKNFDQVILFYPKFVNVFIQENETVDITHTSEKSNDSVEKVDHIFEPELLEILEFFETQIRKLLFMRIMLESELSRTAARLVKMNSTEGRAEKSMNEKGAELRKEIMVLNDIRLLETFSSVLQWKKI